MTQKTKRILRWIPSFAIAMQMAMSAIMKFASNDFFVKNFRSIGLLDYMNLIGCMELLFLSLFMWKPTMRLGLLLLTGYFGGAMAIEFMHRDGVVPAFILFIIWIAAYLREPSFLKPGTAGANTGKILPQS